MPERSVKPFLVDSHVHLDAEEFAGELPQLLERAEAAGVGGLICVGINLASSERACQLAGQYDNVWASVGVHPHDADVDPQLAIARLRTLAAHKRVVAIGETGLDYYRDRQPRPQQRALFRAQLALAAELALPVIVHNREAHADTLALLSAWKRTYPAGRGVLHCFSGDLTLAEQALEMSFSISLAGPLTYASARELQRVAASLPLDSLLLETDAPYLPPQPHRGQRNEPAYLKLTAKRLAELRSLELGEVASATTANAVRLFGLVWPD